MMSEKKIKVGDRVRVKGRTCISTVMYMKDGWVSVDTPIRTAESYPEDDVEYVDPRTAFLQELKELMSKYNADIWADGGWDGSCLHLELDNGREKFNVKEGNLLHGKPIELEDYFEM